MKKFLLPVLALGVLGTGLFTAQYVSAQETSDPHVTLVQRISEKFDLNQADVQQVFDDVRDEHRREMNQKNEERLTEAVREGKITEEQKQLILDKQEEIHSQMKSHMEDVKNMSQDDRKSEMEKARQELETWAEQNGIDMEYVHGGHGQKMMFKRF